MIVENQIGIRLNFKGRVIKLYNDKIEIESPYGHITISYGRHDKHRVRVLDIDGGMESATYIEEELQNELLFEYMYLFDLMFDENYLEDRQINDVLLIGGGAFIIPNIFSTSSRKY